MELIKSALPTNINYYMMIFGKPYYLVCIDKYIQDIGTGNIKNSNQIEYIESFKFNDYAEHDDNFIKHLQHLIFSNIGIPSQPYIHPRLI